MFDPIGVWADPGRGASPGRPVAGREQAPLTHRIRKIVKSRKSPIGLVSEIKLIRTDTTL